MTVTERTAARLWQALVELVSPNWPLLQGTQIDVTDAGACAREATPEQRKTAKEVRAAVEELWELDEGDPLRQHFQRFDALVRGRESRTAAHEARGGTRGQEPQLRVPAEILHRILGFVILDSPDSTSALELECLRHLRLVSKAVKDTVQSQSPRIFTRFASRVAKRLLHTIRPKGIAKFAQELYRAASLFAQVTTLYLFFLPDDEGAHQELLSVCHQLKHVVVYADPRVAKSALSLSDPRPLESLEIYGDSGPRYVYLPGFLLQTLEDIKPFLCLPPPEKTDYSRSMVHEAALLGAPRRVMLSDVPLAKHDLLHWSRVLFGDRVKDLALQSIEEDGLAEAAVVDLATILLQNRPGIQSLALNTARMNDECVVSMHLDTNTHLVRFSANGTSITDPRVFRLKENATLTHLSVRGNMLDSFLFDLDVNRALRVLDISNVLDDRSLNSNEVKRFISDLAAQLSSNGTLEELYLEQSQLEDDHIAPLHLDENTGLRKLSLAHNFISETGFRSLHVDGNSTLRIIDMRVTWLSPSVAKEFTVNGRTVLADPAQDLTFTYEGLRTPSPTPSD